MNKKGSKNFFYWPVLVIILIPLLMLTACREVNVIEVDEPAAGTDFNVLEDIDRAEATLHDINMFDSLPTGVWKNPSILKWWVATDSVGQAQICPAGKTNSDGSCQDVACHIYVFADSDFGPMCCAKDEKELAQADAFYDIPNASAEYH